MKSKVGFVINGRVPTLSAVARGMNPLGMLMGWDDRRSPMSEMRFHWIARQVAGSADYRLYRRGEKYDAVVFVKSMTHECRKLAESLHDRSTCVIFDANVDYYTEAGMGSMPRDLVPSASQRAQAVEMTRLADMVMASSSHLASICSGFNPSISWIPDNVNPALVPPPARCARGPELNLWWSGMPQKAIDLLALSQVLPRLGTRIRLHLVTGDLASAMRGMEPAKAEKLRSLFGKIPHEIHRYRSVGNLLRLYAASPGIIISPRFLDNPYNLSHSEWKITLGMACGLPAVTSPQPSYLDVRARCRHDRALIICSSDEEWISAIQGAMDNGAWDDASDAARQVVSEHYSTPVVARQHLEAITSCIGTKTRPLS